MIPGGGQQAIIESFQLRELTPSVMRATAYSNVVDLISDGRLPATHANATVTELVCLEPLAVSTDEDEAINFVFPDINDVHQCSLRAIITSTNRVVHAPNRKILTMCSV